MLPNRNQVLSANSQLRGLQVESEYEEDHTGVQLTAIIVVWKKWERERERERRKARKKDEEHELVIFRSQRTIPATVAKLKATSNPSYLPFRSMHPLLLGTAHPTHLKMQRLVQVKR